MDDGWSLAQRRCLRDRSSGVEPGVGVSCALKAAELAIRMIYRLAERKEVVNEGFADGRRGSCRELLESTRILGCLSVTSERVTHSASRAATPSIRGLRKRLSIDLEPRLSSNYKRPLQNSAKVYPVIRWFSKLTAPSHVSPTM